jgi:hypothetical protein
MALLSVSIELDKRRNLRFGMRALTEIEKEYPGQTINEIFEQLQQSPSITMICKFLRAGLSKEDPSLTTETLIDILDDTGKDLWELMDVLHQALNEAMKAKNGTAGVAEKEATPA